MSVFTWTQDRINQLSGLPSYAQVGEMIAQLPAMARQLDDLESRAQAFDMPGVRVDRRVETAYSNVQAAKAKMRELDRMVRDAAEAAVRAGQLKRTADGYGLAGWPEQIIGVTAMIGAIIALYLGLGLFIAGFLFVLAAIELAQPLLDAATAALHAAAGVVAQMGAAGPRVALPLGIVAAVVGLGLWLFRPKRGAA